MNLVVMLLWWSPLASCCWGVWHHELQDTQVSSGGTARANTIGTLSVATWVASGTATHAHATGWRCQTLPL